MPFPFARRRARPLPLLALTLLAGCEAELSVHLTDSPVDSAESVTLGITGVTLLTEGNEAVTLSLGETRLLNLLDYRNGTTYRLIGGEKVDNARYVGIALNFADDSSYVERSDGGIVAIETSSIKEFADIDLSLGEQDEESLVLELNLRFSLVDNTSTSGTYALEPVLRAVRPDDSVTVSGVVASSLVESDACRQGRASTTGVAVYAYSGLDLTPIDYVGQSNLLDAAPVVLDTSTGRYRYSLHFLPAGSYTLALTCEADSENPTVQDGLTFESSANITIDAGESGELNFL